MAVLTDQNLTEYKKAIDSLNVEIGKWSTYLSNAEKVLNNSTGSTFRTKYAKGKKATQNIQSVIDILQALKNDLTKLVNDATNFYNISLAASRGTVQKLYGCPVSESVKEAITEAELYSEIDSVIKTVNIN